MNGRQERRVQTMIRIPRELAERVAHWATVMDVSHSRMMNIAFTRWEQLRPFDEAGTTPASDDNAPNKAND